MAEIVTITVIGALVGGILSGGVFWLQKKWDAEAHEKMLRHAAEEKAKLAPALSIRLDRYPDDLQGKHLPPLKRYSLMINNINPNSVPILKMSMEFNFKNVVEEVRTQVLLQNTEGMSVEDTEIWVNKADGTMDYLREEPRNPEISKRFAFRIQTLNVNKNIENLNFVDLYVDKWDERGSTFVAEVVIDTSKQSRIDKKLGERGSYKGSYSYEVAGHQYTEQLHGNIPDEPVGWESYTFPLHRKGAAKP